MTFNWNTAIGAATQYAHAMSAYGTSMSWSEWTERAEHVYTRAAQDRKVKVVELAQYALPGWECRDMFMRHLDSALREYDRNVAYVATLD